MVNLEEIPMNIRRQIEFKPVRHMDEVLDIALLGNKEIDHAHRD